MKDNIMKVGEIWYYAGMGCYSVYNKSINCSSDPTPLQIERLDPNECFTILEVQANNLEYFLCILYNNKKLYFEVAKHSIDKGLFKKL